MTTYLEHDGIRGPRSSTPESPGPSDARWRVLMRAMPAHIVTTTAGGEIEDISETYQQYTGLTLAEAQDWQSHQIIHPDDVPQSLEVWGRSIATGEPMQNEMRLRRHDGIYRWHLVQGTPVRSEDGQIERWITVSVDIDDRKRAEMHERYLAETTARLVAPVDSDELLGEIARLAVPTLADICAIGLFDGTSQTARVETAGADERERPLVARVHLRRWLAVPGGERTIGATIADGRPVYVPDFSETYIDACAPDDEQMSAAKEMACVSLICVPLLARNMAIGMATFAITRSRRQYGRRDLDLLREVAARLSIALENRELYRELEATAERLQRANAAKDEFLGMVSHELRTPITTILGNAQILRRRIGSIDLESRTAALADIEEGAERLQQVIDDLLALARIERGEDIELEPLIVRRLVERVIEEHRKRAPEREFRLAFSGPAAPIAGGPAHVEHVLRNLLSNAEKYSPAGSPIDVQVVRDEQEVRVMVLDRGSGVAEDERDMIFQPFYRSPRTAKLASGVGIGLAVCRRIIEAQNGRIWVSARDDGGSEFGFALPITDADADE